MAVYGPILNTVMCPPDYPATSVSELSPKLRLFTELAVSYIAISYKVVELIARTYLY